MKRAKLTASLLILATLLSVSMVSSVKADTYSDTAKDPYAWPECRIYLAISTDTKKLEFKWDAPAWLVLPFPNLKFVEVVWHVWDDKGFDVAGLSATPITQTVTFDYYNTYTWAYAEAYWFYVFMNVPWLAHAKIFLYVGSSGGGGGGGGCPTLFVWNGTSYVEEGILNIHAESDVTVQHTIQNTPVLKDGFYNLQLRELDNYTSHIDQVKLYAIDGQGEGHLCPLTYAYHSSLGKVKQTLLLDDSNRVDLKPTETIDLKFAPSRPYSETAYFIFEINGYNQKTPF